MRFLAIVPALLIAGCDMRPEHAAWREGDCGRYETSTSVGVGTAIGPNGQVSTVVAPVVVSICVDRRFICVPGKDGSTKCQGRPQ